MQSAKLKISFHSILAATVLTIAAVELRAQAIDEDGSRSQRSASQSTTQPAVRPARLSRSQWSATVAAFSAALQDSSDSDALNALLSDDVVVRKFNRAGRQERDQLREQVGGMNVIMQQAYSQTPSTLADDIANAIKDVPLPEEIKRRLTPPDDAAMKRANVIANKWIAASLFTSGSEPVAIVVLWGDLNRPTPLDRTAGDEKDGQDKAADTRMPVFILLKGDLVGERMQISQICYGDPLPFSLPGGEDKSAASGD